MNYTKMKNKLQIALEKIKIAEEKIKKGDAASAAADFYSAAYGGAAYAASTNWKKAEEKIKEARKIIKGLIKNELHKD